MANLKYLKQGSKTLFTALLLITSGHDGFNGPINDYYIPTEIIDLAFTSNISNPKCQPDHGK